MRALLLGALLLAACGPAPSPATSSGPSAVHENSPAPSVVTSSVPAPSLTFADDASAEWPAVLYEGDGAIVRQRTAMATSELARPCGEVATLEARTTGLLVTCRTPSPDSAELRLVSIPDGRVTVLASGVHPSWHADISPDGRSVVAFRLGNCVSPAPVCQTRAVLIDVTSKSERELLPSGYYLGATLGWTSLGLTLFQPECAEAGCAGRDKTGTFVWDGSAFKRWADLRFVETSGAWTLLEGLRSFGEEPRRVIVRGPAGDVTVSSGHALAIGANGDTLVWRPGSPREQQGVLMRYAPDGRVLWQADLVGNVINVIGPDVLLVSSPTSKIEIYDLKRMLRFAPTTPINYVVAGVAR